MNVQHALHLEGKAIVTRQSSRATAPVKTGNNSEDIEDILDDNESDNDESGAKSGTEFCATFRNNRHSSALHFRPAYAFRSITDVSC